MLGGATLHAPVDASVAVNAISTLAQGEIKTNVLSFILWVATSQSFGNRGAESIILLFAGVFPFALSFWFVPLGSIDKRFQAFILLLQ